MPFKPGQSGNPRGRPRRGKTLTESVKRVLREPHTEGKTKGEALADVLVELALDEKSIPAIKEIFDRLEGRAPQALELSGPEGGPIPHKVNHGIDVGDYTEAFEALVAVGSQNGLPAPSSNGSEEPLDTTDP